MTMHLRKVWLAGLSGAALLAAIGLPAVRAVAADEKDMVPLPLELPEPAFAGTPKEAPEDSDVEPPRKGPRPIPKVPKGTKNLALGKEVTSSSRSTFSGTLDQITDGKKEAYEENTVELKPRTQWVQIDLGAASPLHYICIWHYHHEPVIVHDVVVQISNDPQFEEGVITLFNNDKDNSSGQGAGKDKEYWETFEGKLIAAGGKSARYVRMYSKGSSHTDPLNRYTEVEIFGEPK